MRNAWSTSPWVFWITRSSGLESCSPTSLTVTAQTCHPTSTTKSAWTSITWRGLTRLKMGEWSRQKHFNFPISVLLARRFLHVFIYFLFNFADIGILVPEQTPLRTFGISGVDFLTYRTSLSKELFEPSPALRRRRASTFSRCPTHATLMICKWIICR